MGVNKRMAYSAKRIAKKPCIDALRSAIIHYMPFAPYDDATI